MSREEPPVNPPGSETKAVGDDDLFDKVASAGDDIRIEVVDVDADGSPDTIVIELEEPPYNPPDNSQKAGPEPKEGVEDTEGDG